MSYANVGVCFRWSFKEILTTIMSDTEMANLGKSSFAEDVVFPAEARFHSTGDICSEIETQVGKTWHH